MLNKYQIIVLTIVALHVLTFVAIYSMYPIQSILATIIFVKHNS